MPGEANRQMLLQKHSFYERFIAEEADYGRFAQGHPVEALQEGRTVEPL